MPKRLQGSNESMTEWLRLATDASIVRRAVGVAAVVGSVLIVINHEDAIEPRGAAEQQRPRQR